MVDNAYIFLQFFFLLQNLYKKQKQKKQHREVRQGVQTNNST